MPQDKVELRQRLDFGQMISYYFDFLKHNIKPFTNIFLRYNGIFMLGFLGVSYLMVTGFFGATQSSGPFGANNDSAYYTAMLGLGALAFLLLLIIVGGLNYSLSSVYMNKYVLEHDHPKDINGPEVWRTVTKRFGNIVIFMLLLILIYAVVAILGLIISFIPLVGFFGRYIIQMAMGAWMGMSLLIMFSQNKGVTDSMQAGWNLLTANFWKCVGVNFIMGVILGILVLFVLSVPGIIFGVISYHYIDSSSGVMNQTILKIIWTVILAIVLFLMAYGQALTQFVNGVLYFSLNEQKTNNFLRSRIDQIGSEQ